MQEKKGNKFHRRVTEEEHYTIVEEPGSAYWVTSRRRQEAGLILQQLSSTILKEIKLTYQQRVLLVAIERQSILVKIRVAFPTSKDDYGDHFNGSYVSFMVMNSRFAICSSI